MSRLFIVCAVCALFTGCRVIRYENVEVGASDGGFEPTFVVLNYKVLQKEVDEKLLQLLAVNLKAFNNLLMTRLGRPRQALHQMVMRLYRNRDEFEKVVKREGVVRYDGSGVDMSNRAVALLLAGDVMEGIKRAHTYVYLSSFSSRFPSWVVDGFVEYFGDAKLVGGQFVVPLCSDARLRRFIASVEESSVRLSDVIGVPSGRRLRGVEKEWAWVLTYWFMRVYPKRGDALARKKALMRYLARIMEDGGSSVSFEECMGRKVTEIEEAVLRWAKKRSEEDVPLKR